MTDFSGSAAPDLDAFRDLARTRRVIPVVRRLLADGITAVGLFDVLCGERAGTFLLESAEGGERFGRYSFIGTEPYKVLRTGVPGSKQAAADPLVAVEKELSQFKVAKVPGLPRFQGGAPEVDVVLKSADGRALADAVSWLEPALDDVASRTD